MKEALTPEQAVKKYYKLAKTVAQKYVRPGILLEDLHQEALLALFQAAKAWVPGKKRQSYKNYLVFSVRDRLKEVVRKNVSMLHLDEPTIVDDHDSSYHDLIGVAPSQETHAAHVSKIGGCMNSLEKERYKNIVHLRAQGMTFTEIAQELRVSRQLIEKQWGKIQKLLAGEETKEVA